MQKNIKKDRPVIHFRFGKNFLSFGYVQAVTIAIQLALVPFFLMHWGTEYYAEWIVITGIPQLLVFLDAGTSLASGNRATMFASNKEPEKALTSLHTGTTITIVICGLVFISALFQHFFIDWENTLNLKRIDANTANSTISLMLGYLCCNLISGPISAWFRTIDRTATGTFLIANKRALDILVSIVILSSNGTAETLAGALFTSQIIANLLILAFLNKISPWSIFSLKQASKHELKQVWAPALAGTGIPIAQTITLQGGVQVLNLLGSQQETIVAYSMVRTLVRLIIQIGITSTNALVPEIARKPESSDAQKIKKFVNRVSLIVISISIVLYIGLIIVGPKFIEIWSQGKIYAPGWIFAILGLHAIINTAWYIPSSLLIATNKHIAIGLLYAASSALALAAWIAVGTRIDPIVGAGLLLAIPEIAILTHTIKKHLNTNRAEAS